ncbi:MAG: PEP-CTERM sorting domain-containing protein [Sedimentisphaerales bacterium]
MKMKNLMFLAARKSCMSHFLGSTLLGCALLLGGVTAKADTKVVSSASLRNVTAPFGRHNVPAMPTGTTTIHASAEDSLFTPPGPGTKAGDPVVASTPVNYATSAKPASAGPVSAPGTNFKPKAYAILGWGYAPAAGFGGGSWYWDSTGSYATLTPLGAQKIAEFAEASAIVNDPAQFTYEYESDETDPGVQFGTIFEAGMELASQTTGPEMSTSALLTGSFETSLLSSPLWTYSWTCTSSGEMSFDFNANPALGIDSTLIESEFLSNLQYLDGVYTLLQDVTVDVIIPVIPDSDRYVTFTSGGAVGCEVDGATVPEPATVCLLGLGGLALLRRRRKQAD